jgi:hypothetical protein
MASIGTFELIAVDEDLFWQDTRLVSNDDGDVITVPIPRKGQVVIWGMTIAFAAIATPSCYFVATYLIADNFRVPFAVFTKYVVVVAWMFAVFGPVGTYYLLPFGWWNPDHWLKYDRRTRQLSVRGGFHRWHRDQIHCIVAIACSRKPSKRFATELQIWIHERNQVNKYLLLHTNQADPETAFGRVLCEFAIVMKVPLYLAKVLENGTTAVQQIVDGPNIRHEDLDHPI